MEWTNPLIHLSEWPIKKNRLIWCCSQYEKHSKSNISESDFTTLKLILRKLSRLWEQTEYVAFYWLSQFLRLPLFMRPA